jgi:hypothetical protein
MVQFTITIVEQDGAVSLHVTRGQENPTELEAALLAQECRMGFNRHSDSIQRLAERSLKQLNKTVIGRSASDLVR